MSVTYYVALPFTLFGGLQFGGDTKFPDGRFTKFSVITRQTAAAAQATKARVHKEKTERAERGITR
jgi:hypothetical protein